MPGRLQDRIAIITGSSSGIGRATALAYAREGATVVCSDVRADARPELAEATSGTTVEEIEKLGGTAIFVTCDTSNSEDVQTLVKTAVQKFGRLDIMVNNAGIGAGIWPIWDTPEDLWDRTQAVNLRGVFLGTKYAALQMRAQEPLASGDRGWIVNVASVLGLGGAPGNSAYVASKHGVMGLTKAAAWDCAKERIHVNAICPGYTATSMTKFFFDDDPIRTRLESMHPFRGLGTPEDMAKAAVFLASEDASWITGVGLPVDGGYSSL